MRARHLIVFATAATVAAATVLTGLTPGVAWGGWQHEPITADVNGDGIADRSTLGGTQTTCSVLVELGLASGGFATGQSYAYLTLPTGDGNCPDMGVGLNLDDDAPDELAVAWFAGPPSGIGGNLLALDGFQVSGGFNTIFQPSYIGTADFNGDGRDDVYEWTDQGDGFATYLNTGAGTLVPGPVRYCSGRPQFHLVDFDRDGGMDVVIAYAEGCGAYFTGVVVMLDDGTVIDLHGDPYGDDYWEVAVLDANQDGISDVQTHSFVTDARATFIGTGTGQFVRAPVAVRDHLAIRGDRATGIRVKANDYASTQARVSILTPPTQGTVKVTTNGTVIYTPYRRHSRTDRFVYQLTEHGRTSNATVTLKIVG